MGGAGTSGKSAASLKLAKVMTFLYSSTLKLPSSLYFFHLFLDRQTHSSLLFPKLMEQPADITVDKPRDVYQHIAMVHPHAPLFMRKTASE